MRSGEPDIQIADRVEVAETLSARMIGLAGRRSLRAGEGMWLRGTNGIHTFGMRFPIDVIVLDRENRVLRIRMGLRPWRILWPVRGGRATLELAAGSLHNADPLPGDKVRLEPADV